MYLPVDYEAILIGSVLRHGRNAALFVLPQLTADKFVHGFGGILGGEDNRKIWAAIEQTVLVERADPNLATGAIRLQLEGDLLTFAEAYANDLIYKYRIERIDGETLRVYANRVHKQGYVYRFASIGKKLGNLTTPEIFNNYVEDKVDDPELWGSQVISELHGAISDGGDARYVHIAEKTEETVARLDQQQRGEQVYLLPIGFPVLASNGLFPAQSMNILHGLSSGGKSTLLHNVINLGTAIGLVYNKTPGCVAINSLEMDFKAFQERAAASLAGFNVFNFRVRPTTVPKEDYDRFISYVRFTGKLPIWVDDTPGINMDQLTMRLAGVHLGQWGPVRQLSTDYLELFSTDGDSREQELSDLTAAHFNLARRLNTCVIAVSQSTYTSKTFIAGMYGARYSRALTQKPDIILELINYGALKRSGTDYIVADGYDEEHVWLNLQKYRGGATDVRIKLAWEPEFTRLYDPGMVTIDTNVILFEHLEEVRKLLAKHPTTNIVPFEDTPLSHLGGDF